MIARRPGSVQPSAIRWSPAAAKSSKVFCLFLPLPARCQASPSSPPPRRPAQANTPPTLTQARTWARYRGDIVRPKPP